MNMPFNTNYRIMITNIATERVQNKWLLIIEIKTGAVHDIVKTEKMLSRTPEGYAEKYYYSPSGYTVWDP